MNLIFDFPLLILIVVFLLIYYGGFLLYFRNSVNILSDSSYTFIPQNYSPAAIRYIWLGEADYNALIASFLSAVNKGIYTIRWQVNGFSINLKNPGALNDLIAEEKAALTFSNGYPVKGLGVGIKKNSMLDKRMDALETQLEKTYGHLLSPRKKYVLGGVILSAFGLLVYDYFYFGSGWEFIIMKFAIMLLCDGFFRLFILPE